MRTYIDYLNARRKTLGMSIATIAHLSRVSKPTVARILAGHHPNASVGNVDAIAQTLGLALSFNSVMKPHELREQQARKKARSLVGMVQGTSGLEAQAIDSDQLEAMTSKTVHDLLAGSPRRLWGS